MNSDDIQRTTIISLLALLLWREASGQTHEERVAIAWSVRNRVYNPGKDWWGDEWDEVIEKKEQYTSMSHAGDPNLTRWPRMADTIWADCVNIAEGIYRGDTVFFPNPVADATHYFDASLDSHPPAWYNAEGSRHVCNIGRFRFWRVR